MSKQKYKYLVVMSNGNKYEIIAKQNIREFLRDIYGTPNLNLMSAKLSRTINQYQFIVTNSKYISEILCEGEVNE